MSYNICIICETVRLQPNRNQWWKTLVIISICEKILKKKIPLTLHLYAKEKNWHKIKKIVHGRPSSRPPKKQLQGLLAYVNSFLPCHNNHFNLKIMLLFVHYTKNYIYIFFQYLKLLWKRGGCRVIRPQWKG